MLLIAPAVPDTPVGVNTMRFGVLKFARSSKLKISALNCTECLALRVTFLNNAMSHWYWPGLYTPSRGALPKVPVAGLVYASGLNVGDAVKKAAVMNLGDAAREFLDFVANAKKRGICPLKRSGEEEMSI